MKSTRTVSAVEAVAADINKLRAVGPRVVAALIGEGVFGQSDRLVRLQAFDDAADREGAQAKSAQLRAELKAAGLSDGVAEDSVETAYEIADRYADGAFLVGLAVGLALGSGQPFAGISKNARAK